MELHHYENEDAVLEEASDASSANRETGGLRGRGVAEDADADEDGKTQPCCDAQLRQAS